MGSGQSSAVFGIDAFASDGNARADVAVPTRSVSSPTAAIGSVVDSDRASGLARSAGKNGDKNNPAPFQITQQKQARVRDRNYQWPGTVFPRP
jgi:hypothetical protein